MKRGKPLNRGSGLKRGGKLPDRNDERRKRLYEKQFGDKADFLRSQSRVCAITGLAPTSFYPLEVAHVGHPDREVRRAGHGTRGNGADSTYTLLLRKDFHQHFDNLDEAKFEELYGLSKRIVREEAVAWHDKYLASLPESLGSTSEAEESSTTP